MKFFLKTDITVAYYERLKVVFNLENTLFIKEINPCELHRTETP